MVINNFDKQTSLTNKCVDSGYFTKRYNLTDEEMNNVTDAAAKLPRLTTFGIFDSDQHYLASVDLLISSILETQHRNQILTDEILPNLKKFDNLLDIGIGNGDLTRLVGQNFTNITAIDVSKQSLDNIQPHDFSSLKHIDKIHGSVLDVEIPDKNYDLILLSHTIYYIKPELRTLLINKLYNLLSDQGTIIIIFTEGGSRYKLTQHFNGTNFDFDDFIEDLGILYDLTNIIQFQETIQTNSIEPMLHIASVCLADAAASASVEELTSYLNSHSYSDGIYYLSMSEQMILIGNTGNV